MKKLILALALALPMIASAQKFGHVNTEELFAQMPQIATIKLQMDTIQSQYENQLAMMQEELQKKAQDYQAQEATLADGIKQVRQQELNEMYQRIQLFQETARQDVQKSYQDLIMPVHEKMSKAIQAVGAKEGYTYIFDTSAMVYIAPDAIDVTPVVKKELGI